MENQQLPSRSLPTSPRSSPIKSQLPAGIMAAPSNDDTKGMSGLLAERMAEGGGALCIDKNGLCLGSRGNIDASKSGVYTAIAKLASQLDSTVDGSGGNPQEVPLVTIQTEKAALLVKEYGGRTVVFRCPSETDVGASVDKEEAGEEQGGGDEPATAS